MFAWMETGAAVCSSVRRMMASVVAMPLRKTGSFHG
jgi:hypothetical protein